MSEVTEQARDSWLPMPSWMRSVVASVLAAFLIGGAGWLVTWGSWEARAEAEAAKLEEHAERLSSVAEDAARRREMTAARVGALEVRQAEQGARFDALVNRLEDIQESLRRLEDRFGTRRGRDD